MSEQEPDLAWTELGAGEWTGRGEQTLSEPLRPDEFRTYLVQVKSDAEIGKEMHYNPIEVLRRETRIEIPEGVRLTMLRANAEVPANPVHRSYVVLVFGGLRIAIAVEYKYEKDGS
jgi:hypothetical protein